MSRRLSPETIVYPTASQTNVDKSNCTCEECGLTFSTGRGKTIHFTKMHQNTNNKTTMGFSKCGDKRCNTCKLGTFGDSIMITSTNSTFTIKQPITCKSKNVIYCVTCKKCRAQYIGETEQELHSRQRGHLSDINHNAPGLPYVTHFEKCGIENYTITGIEKLRQNSRDIRKSREKFYKQFFDVKIK